MRVMRVTDKQINIVRDRHTTSELRGDQRWLIAEFLPGTPLEGKKCAISYREGDLRQKRVAETAIASAWFGEMSPYL